jgi:SAM-dependent methyltransferase
MNLIQLVSLLERNKIGVETAYGTDFAATLVNRARLEASVLPEQQRARVKFLLARNECLADDLVRADGDGASVTGSFDLVIGVNTFRYCHRLRAEHDCARDIKRLLRPGGVCVVIDMNDCFPLFRSRFRSTAESPGEIYLPSLDEYTSPFEHAGFEILTKDHFCWIPHSAGAGLTLVGRALTPFLNVVARRYAMRSLVVARRPA